MHFMRTLFSIGLTKVMHLTGFLLGDSELGKCVLFVRSKAFIEVMYTHF